MKILRILRRRKIKLSFIFLLLFVFILNTYAWMSTDKNTQMGNISLNVDDWSVSFIINNEEVLTEEYTFELEEFYPGIASEDDPIVKEIDVYNIGEANSFLKYEITEIYLYGEQIYNIENVVGEETISVPETITEEIEDENGITTANIFGNSNAIIFKEEANRTEEEKQKTNYTFSLRYPTPFTITYSYESTHIAGRDQSEAATSWMKINLAWENDENNNIEDTRLGNMVYEFENAKDAEGNLINEGKPALKIVAKVTADREFK